MAFWRDSWTVHPQICLTFFPFFWAHGKFDPASRGKVCLFWLMCKILVLCIHLNNWTIAQLNDYWKVKKVKGERGLVVKP